MDTCATVDVRRSEGKLRCWMSSSSSLFETESLMFSSACARLAALRLPESLISISHLSVGERGLQTHVVMLGFE